MPRHAGQPIVVVVPAHIHGVDDTGRLLDIHDAVHR